MEKRYSKDVFIKFLEDHLSDIGQMTHRQRIFYLERDLQETPTSKESLQVDVSHKLPVPPIREETKIWIADKNELNEIPESEEESKARLNTFNTVHDWNEALNATDAKHKRETIYVSDCSNETLIVNTSVKYELK